MLRASGRTASLATLAPQMNLQICLQQGEGMTEESAARVHAEELPSASSLDEARQQLHLALQLALLAGARMQELGKEPDVDGLMTELGTLIERYGPEAIADYVTRQG